MWSQKALHRHESKNTPLLSLSSSSTGTSFPGTKPYLVNHLCPGIARPSSSRYLWNSSSFLSTSLAARTSIESSYDSRRVFGSSECCSTSIRGSRQTSDTTRPPSASTSSPNERERQIAMAARTVSAQSRCRVSSDVSSSSRSTRFPIRTGRANSPTILAAPSAVLRISTASSCARLPPSLRSTSSSVQYRTWSCPNSPGPHGTESVYALCFV
mmetsp:Transcript_24313/g.57760  ORF Transcript_24313/g.57760 Transcript_24313/m.57760 type:complete len:213 (-) Transcript_24313:394-1032(-)